MAESKGADSRASESLDARVAALESEVRFLRSRLAQLEAAAVPRAPPAVSPSAEAPAASYSLLDTVDKYRRRLMGAGANRRVKVCINGTWVSLTKPPDFKKQDSHAVFAGARGQLMAEERSLVTIASKSIHELPFQLLAGDLLCWEFTVEEAGADIGFALRKRDYGDGEGLQVREVDLPWEGIHNTGLTAKQATPGTAPMQLTRYGPVCRGGWGPALQPSEVIFCWDNSYSGWSKKTISYTIRVFNEDQAVAVASRATAARASAAASTGDSSEVSLGAAGAKESGLEAEGREANTAVAE